MSAATSVTFEVGDWPTPNHCRSAADALDALSYAKYGDILRAYADAEDARSEAHGSIRVCRQAAPPASVAIPTDALLKFADAARAVSDKSWSKSYDVERGFRRLHDAARDLLDAAKKATA
jgi:hypothetical protein